MNTIDKHCVAMASIQGFCGYCQARLVRLVQAHTRSAELGLVTLGEVRVCVELSSLDFGYRRITFVHCQLLCSSNYILFPVKSVAV